MATTRLTPAHFASLVVWLPALCGVLPALYFYVRGNGLVPGAFALAVLAAFLVTLIGASVARDRYTRLCLAAAVGQLASMIVFAAVRVSAVSSGAPIRACVDGSCASEAPILARIVREDETARAGTELAAALGWIFPLERPVVTPALYEKYGALDRLRFGSAGPNALLLGPSSPDRVDELIYLPSGASQVPAVIFLHGFGGSLTAYVSTLLESSQISRMAIVAPILDTPGAWWNDRGLAVLEHTLRTLPPEVDRSRVYLVGLSNGATGTTAAAARPALAAQFKAAVAIEGVATTDLTDPTGPLIPLLVVAAESDERFDLDFISETVEQLQRRGAPVELQTVSGTHMAFFTSSTPIVDATAAWIRAHP